MLFYKKIIFNLTRVLSGGFTWGAGAPPTALQTVDPPTAPPKNFSTIDEGREELKVEEGHQPPLFLIPGFAPGY